MPANHGRGGRWQCHRRVINGILFRQRTGLPWRDLPPCFGSWKTVHDRHRRWSADGTWERILRAVQADADTEGRIDWSMVSVDSTTCRAHQHAARASTRAPKIPGRRRTPERHRPDEALGRSRGGLTSKIHLAGEGGCRPLGFVITPGQWGDAPQMIPVLEEIRVPRQAGGRLRTRPDHVGGDKAYSSLRNRRHLRRRQIKHTIPEPRDQRANRRRRGRQGGRPQGSTRRSTAAATKSSGLSTDSRPSEPSPRASTNGCTSSTERSPWRRSAYGFVRNEVPRSEILGTRVVVAKFAKTSS